MHRSFFAIKDTFINSGSDLIDGTTFQDKNTGQDEILEIKKVFNAAGSASGSSNCEIIAGKLFIKSK